MKRPNLFRKISILFLLLGVMSAGAFAQSKKDKDAAKKLQEAGDKAFAAKNYREAVDKYSQSAALVSTNAKLHYFKGYSHYNLQENVEALNEFAIALSQGYKPLDIYKIRTYIYYETKNFDAALAEVNKALALTPNDLILLKSSGEINLGRNAYAEALASFNKAAQLAPKDGDIYYNIARIHLGLNDRNRRPMTAEKALANGTRFVGETYYFLGERIKG